MGFDEVLVISLYSARYQNLHSLLHQHSLQMFFYKNVIENRPNTATNTNTNNFDSSMVWASPQTKKVWIYRPWMRQREPKIDCAMRTEKKLRS